MTQETQELGLLPLFEDVYRANLRLSLVELDEILTQVEQLAVSGSRRKHSITVQRALRRSLNEILTASEKRLAELRTRYDALPALSSKAQKGA